MNQSIKNLKTSLDKTKASESNEESFDIYKYGYYNYLTIEEVNHCGTTGCGLGEFATHWPVKDSYFTLDEIGDEVYSYMQFSKDIFPDFDIDAIDEEWDFLFNSTWNDHQPTQKEFFKRCEIVIEGKYKPGWDYWRSDSEEFKNHFNLK